MGYVLALWGEFVKFTGGRAGLVHLLLFAAALVCCFFLGKEERHRLFWPSVLVGIFFFNPVFYKYVGTRFLSGVYWRLLWMLPWTFVIAYAVVRMAYRLGKQALRIVVVAVACVCIFVTGKPVLSAETYGERSNVYELLCSVRQYSASACLLYGRNAEGFISGIGEEEQQVYEEMSSEHPDVARVTEIAKNKNCRYIVFNTSFHQIPEDLTEYGYEKIAVIEDVYAVYSRIGS